MGPLPIILLSPGEQVILSESEEKYAQTKHHLQVKTVQNSSKQICLWLMWEEQGMDLYTGWSVIVDYGGILVIKFFKVFLTNRFLLDQPLMNRLESLFVDYCDVFISCLDTNSDGTHSLQRIHWLASDVKLNFSKPVPMKKQTLLRLARGWANFHQIDHFWH